MKLIRLLIIAVVFTSLAGCNRGPQNSVEGDKGQKLTVAVTDKILNVEQAADQKFTVTVNREKLTGDVKLSFKLPKNLTIKEPESDRTFADGTNQKIFTLQVGDKAKPEKNVRIRVVASHPDLPAAEADLKIHIEESLENKAERQKAFIEKTAKTLMETKKNLKNAETMITANIKEPEKKATFFKEITKLYESLDRVADSVEKIKSAPAQTWERQRPEVERGLTSIQENADEFVKRLGKLTPSRR